MQGIESNNNSNLFFSIDKLLKQIAFNTERSADVLENVFGSNKSNTNMSIAGLIASLQGGSNGNMGVETTNNKNTTHLSILTNLVSGNNQLLKDILISINNIKEDILNHVNGLGNIFNSMKSVSINFFDKSLSIKELPKVNTTLTKLLQLIDTDPEKIERVSQTLTNLSEKLGGLINSSKSVSMSLLLIAGGVLAFSFINLSAIAKATIGVFLLLKALSWGMSSLFDTFNKIGVDKSTNLLRRLPYLIGSIALAVVPLSISLLLMNYVDFSSVFKFILAFGGLVGVFKLFATNINPQLPKSLSLFSFSLLGLVIALKLFEYVNWASIGKSLVFLGLLGLTLKTTFPSRQPDNLTQIGIGLIAVSVGFLAFSHMNIAGVFAGIGALALLGVVLSKFTSGGIIGNTPATSTLFKLGLGIIAVVGAMLLFSLVSFTSMFKFLGFMVGMIGVLKLAGFLKNRAQTSPLFMFGLGISILVLAVSAFDEINWSTIGLFLAFMLTTSLIASSTRSKRSGIFMFGLGIAIIALSLDAFSEIQWGAVFKFVGVLGAIALFSRITGNVGTIGLLAVAGAIWIVSKTFASINEIKWDILNMGAFMLSVGAIVLGTSALSLLIVPALLGAVGLIAVSGALFISSITMRLIANTRIDNTQIDNFMVGVERLISGIDNIGIIALTKALAKSVLLVPIILSLTLSAGALTLMSHTNIKTPKIESFGVGITKIVKVFDNFGIFQLVKVSAKATALLPVLGTLYLATLSLSSIMELNINKDQFTGFISLLKDSIKEIINVVVDNKDLLNDEQILKGIDAVASIVNSVGSMSTAIESLANMRFNEYEVRNGKLVLKNSRPINDADLKNVGKNIVTLLDALINPLQSIGASINKPKITIGGYSVDNPFVSSNMDVALDFMKRLAESFNPIIDTLQKYFSTPIFSQPLGAVNFATNFNLLIGTLQAGLMRLSDKKQFNISQIEDVIEQLSEMGTLLTDKFHIDDMSKLSNSFVKMVDALSDNSKWSKISKNLKELRNEFWSISKAINTIDIQKATKLNNIIYNLTNKDNTKTLQEILEELRNLINTLKTGNTNASSDASTTTASQQVNTTNTIYTNAGGGNNTNKGNTTTDTNEEITVLREIKELISSLEIPQIPSVQKVHVINTQIAY